MLSAKPGGNNLPIPGRTPLFHWSLIPEDVWEDYGSAAHTHSICMRHRLIQFKVFSRLCYYGRLAKTLPQMQQPGLIRSHVSVPPLEPTPPTAIFGAKPAQTRTTNEPKKAIALSGLILTDSYETEIFHVVLRLQPSDRFPTEVLSGYCFLQTLLGPDQYKDSYHMQPSWCSFSMRTPLVLGLV